MAPGAAGAARGSQLASVVLCALVALLLLALGWANRWNSDDGFINFRVVQQLAAGHGPVFNPGERIEVATSPAWLTVLFVVSRLFWFVALEWVAVVLSLALAGAAVVLAALGGRELHREDSGRVLFPAGLVVFAALPPVWDFLTSGLEVSLSLAWLAGCFLALTRAACSTHNPSPRQGADKAFWAHAVLIGLGPLVRPDFAVFTLAFLAALAFIARPAWRQAVVLLAAAAAVPVLFQVFRMAYYAALVPNTAFAKEASRANWRQGLFYVRDFVVPYAVWLPVVVLAVAAVLLAARSGLQRAHAAAAAVVVGAGLHWVYVARVGGDFMHARLLVPGLFALLLPVAVVPLSRAGAVALAVVPWAVYAGFSARPDYDEGMWGERGIVDAREVSVSGAQHDAPVTTDDYATFWARYGTIAKAEEKAGRPVLFLEEEAYEVRKDARWRLPLAPAFKHSVLSFRFIGMMAYAADADMFVVDRLGLGDPIASRIAKDDPGRPGHEKELDLAWVAARFGAPDLTFPGEPEFEAKVVAAREALRCDGPVADVLRLVTGPASPLRNIKGALTTYGTRFPGDPVLYRDTYCRP